jgi:hypothetical protein
MNWKNSAGLLISGLILAAIITLSGKAVTGYKEQDTVNSAESFKTAVQEYYELSGLGQAGLDKDVFRKAYAGFLNLKAAGKVAASSSVLSVADFTLSSKKKRLWIIDLEQQKLLLHTWVAHGRGSGGDMATQFSNVSNSHQSSLGFYITGEVYNGKHGRSLRLDGMDKGYNHKARERAIVVHGAAYVSQQAIAGLGRLGRSHGCPAVPSALTNRIIDFIRDRTVLFIHGNAPDYRSVYLDEEKAASVLLASAEGTATVAHTGLL